MSDQEKQHASNEKTAVEPRRSWWSWWSRPANNAKERWVEAREHNEDPEDVRAKQRAVKH